MHITGLSIIGLDMGSSQRVTDIIKEREFIIHLGTDNLFYWQRVTTLTVIGTYRDLDYGCRMAVKPKSNRSGVVIATSSIVLV